MSASLATGLAAPLIHAAGSARPEKSLHLYNTHTGEVFRNVFWTREGFVPDALDKIGFLLRDHRSNQVAAIDPALLLLLEKLSSQVEAPVALHVISGYRSPETNKMLAERTDGVARHSLHLEGRAADIRIPGRDLAMVNKAARRLQSGGVGYYPESQFVHLDTGRVRNW